MISDLFIHTCSITRLVPGDEDEFGIPGTPTPTTTTDVRCRYIRPRGSLRALESGLHLFRQPAILFSPGTDVQEGDTITLDLTDPGIANEYRAGPVHPAYDDQRLHHLHVELEAVV